MPCQKVTGSVGEGYSFPFVVMGCALSGSEIRGRFVTRVVDLKEEVTD